MTLTHTISLVEILWTVISAMGLWFCGRLFLRAMGDVRWLKENELNGLRQHAATSSVFIYVTMSATQFGYVLIGVIAMILPSPNNHVQPLTYVITAVFITMSVIKTTMAYIINERREALRHMILKEREHEDVLPT